MRRTAVSGAARGHYSAPSVDRAMGHCCPQAGPRSALGLAQVLGFALPTPSQNREAGAGVLGPCLVPSFAVHTLKLPWGWVPGAMERHSCCLCSHRVTHSQAQELQPGQERVSVREQEVHQRQPPLQLL